MGETANSARKDLQALSLVVNVRLLSSSERTWGLVYRLVHDERDSSIGIFAVCRGARSSMRLIMVMALSLPLIAGCAGKKRDFGSTNAVAGATVEAPDDDTLDDSSIAVGGGGGASGSSTNAEAETLPGLGAPVDGELGAASPPASEDACGDACSGECQPGETQCSSPTQRIECGIDALWGEPVACTNVCLDGSCTGECAPGTTECVTTSRFRECSELGVWSEVADCEFACVGATCGGACQPGQTRCASGTTVEVCGEQGEWGAATACQNACVGGACTGECVPGATRCSSETQLQTCNEQGQFIAGAACPFACVNGACGGECSPGSRRCNPGTGVPQFCSGTGLWQSQAPCQFVCTGSGSCGGECSPGSRRCSPVSGVPQLCGQAGSWQSQTACPFVCANGTCGGECSPGSRRCDPASGVPQLCGSAGTWQSQQGCARGCQNGACIPQIGLGTACGAARDCLSGFCADGVCCESACGGVCAQCQAGTGACVAPATDQACSPVICASSDCRLSSGNITSNLCRGFGQCKAQDDCNFSNFERGTPCDTAASEFTFCDGAGSCIDRTVTCNGVAGRVTDENNVCCDTRAGVDFPFTVTESYGSTGSCAVRAFDFPGGTRITCDENADCRSGDVCCVIAASSGSDVTCVPASTCNTSVPFVSYNGLCASPKGFTAACPAGRSCLSLSGAMVSGWANCR